MTLSLFALLSVALAQTAPQLGVRGPATMTAPGPASRRLRNTEKGTSCFIARASTGPMAIKQPVPFSYWASRSLLLRAGPRRRAGRSRPDSITSHAHFNRQSLGDDVRLRQTGGVVIADSGSQLQRPLPAGSPEDFTAPAVRVSVVVHEDLDPDLLRALARRDVTLWLQTRSNSLRASTLENVARFDEAFVQLRSPMSREAAQSFARLPRAGAWLEVDQLAVVPRLPGARKVAVEFKGALDAELADRVTAAKPSMVRWSPDANAPLDLMQWGLFRQLPGRKVVVMPVSALRPATCTDQLSMMSPELDVATVLTMNSAVYPCGKSTRVVIRPSIDHWMVQSLTVRDPSVELVVLIGTGVNAARETRTILDLLDRHDSR